MGEWAVPALDPAQTKAFLLGSTVVLNPTETVARLMPTLTRLTTASVGGPWVIVERSTLGQDVERFHPYEFSFPGMGWLVVDPKPEYFGAFLLFTITRQRPLPGYLTLSEYDIGHEVVTVRGEFTGDHGTVEQIMSEQKAYTLSCGGTHVHDALGAVRTGDLETLAPLRLRLPPGSACWLVDQPRGWARGVVTGYYAGNVTGWNLDTDDAFHLRRSRQLVLPRDATTPPPPQHPATRRLVPSRRIRRPT